MAVKRGRRLWALAAVLWLGAGARDVFDAWVEATALPILQIETSVEVLDREGALLRAYMVADGRWRFAVAREEVDPLYIEMLLAYEDRRFYEHSGVDLWALARASAQAVWQGRVISGGSTLTMQVARLLEEGSTGRWDGKLRQMRLAWKLERALDKEQISALYLRLAPFGGNLEGLRAASLAYFQKEPRRLTPAQAALLVALPQAPEARRPDRAADHAEAARARVLARARDFGVISSEAAAAALREMVPGLRHAFPALAPHLADRARAEAPFAHSHHLTLDKDLQIRLEDLARDAVGGQGERVQVAILAAEHQSGAILGAVGSAEYQADARQGFVDMIHARRSPGSTLKPLIYALAFDDGLAHPETRMSDRPMRFGSYAPQNFDRHYRGDIRLREALQQSLNIPVVALTEAITPARLLAAMGRAGMGYELPNEVPGLAISLGGIGVSLRDLVQLYASLARGGVTRPLHHRAGALPEGQRLVSGVAAWQVGDILAGLPPPVGAPRNRLAYKTGTSYGHRDAWAIGYDGAHVVGVWMGRADGTPVPGAFGTDTAAPVLFEAFARLKPQLTPQPAPPKATLLVSQSELPAPLQAFRPRHAAFVDLSAPRFDFPPQGAEVELFEGQFKVRISGGRGPFSYLMNGAPYLLATPARELMWRAQGRGFVTLTVIDAEGRAAELALRLL